MDLMGPMPTSYTGGFRYVLTVTEDYSKLSQVSLLKTKDAAHTILNAIARLENMYGAQRKQCALQPRKWSLRVRSGHALQERGIAREPTAPYSSQSNGAVFTKPAAGIRACAC
jgi:hypothetical protein